MQGALQSSFSLVDLSGYLIIFAIVALMAAAIVATGAIHARYRRIERELERSVGGSEGFEARVLEQVMREVAQAIERGASDVNTPAIVEQAFQTNLRAWLVAERFVRASTGLLIILGLVGTFYGLTLSIGKLVALISGDVQGTTEVTASLTRGLTEALSGMSVAFSTSLFGILAAIIMTLVGVFANVGDRRNELMVRIEAYADNVATTFIRTRSPELGAPAQAGAGGPSAQLVASFGQSVLELKNAVAQFDAALHRFATNTRDFQELNLHLKDNVQRMSLSFGDVSDAIKQHVAALRQQR